MDFGQIYLLQEAFTREALRVRPQDPVDELTLLKGEYSREEPIIFEYSSGKIPWDLVGTEYPMLDLVSQRFVEVLRTRSFTGWAVYPVEIYGKAGEKLEGYYGLSVKGKCGPIDNQRSQRVFRESPTAKDNTYEAWIGLFFDPSSWDGSDIFCSESAGYVFVVESLKKALEDARITNVNFVPLEQVERLML